MSSARLPAARSLPSSSQHTSPGSPPVEIRRPRQTLREAQILLPSSVPPEEQARADLYALAARLLLAPPDAPLLEALGGADHPPGDSPGSRLQAEWERLSQASASMPADLAAKEFAALFEGVGSPLIDPYASVYLAGFMMEKPLARLRTELASLGLAAAPGSRKPEDHLGALCETMRLLIAGAPGFDPQPLARQRAFFERHLGAWTERCLDEIAQAAPANFYRCVAGFVRALLEFERAAFELEEPEFSTAAPDRAAFPDPRAIEWADSLDEEGQP